MKTRYKFFCLPALIIISLQTYSQSLPAELHFSSNHQILMGSQPYQGLYDHSQIKNVELTFNEPNFWDTMLVNYYTYIDMPATLQVDGNTYDSVGVRFRGATSFYNIDTLSKKLSFGISLDYAFPDQRIDGYKSLNLNNTYLDNSQMREYVYNTLARQHIPMPRVSYVWLKINGMDWGLYVNLQQLNKDFLKQWYMTNNGSFWRATSPNHHIGPPPNKIGDGKGSMCYLGPQDTTYQKYYTLKSSDDSIPWQRLINSCYQLSITNDSNFMDSLNPYFDVDQTLWMLATENIFSDDDSYIFKGRTDYCIYHDPETGRIRPVQYDGNSVMRNLYVKWSIYYDKDSVNYPLLNKLLNIPSLNQRYLAHYRTLIKDYYDTLKIAPLIDSVKSQIDTLVQADTMKFTTYATFLAYVDVLKKNFATRSVYLSHRPQFENVESPEIDSVLAYVNNVAWKKPLSSDSVLVTAFVSHSAGLNKVALRYGNYYVGNFLATPMYDDGTHGDFLAGDSIYSGFIPPAKAGVMRFYIEAIANDSALTAAYEPEGAEHNVFYYFINPVAAASNGVVINEIMAKNQTAVADSSGEFDDWIELFNNSNVDVDLSDYSISDDTLDYRKFIFSPGMVIPAQGYFILWADDQHFQGITHLNFGLSSSGEQLFLLNPQLELVDSLTFGAQLADSALARLPNGTGNFVTQHETFNKNNDISLSVEQHNNNNFGLQIYPNPANERVLLITNSDKPETVFVFDAYGKIMDTFILKNKSVYNTKFLPNGFYTVRCLSSSQKFVIIH